MRSAEHHIDASEMTANLIRDMIANPGLPSADPASAPAIISVIVRHKRTCPHKHDPQSRECKCLKYLYVYEGGRKSYKSTRTRSWQKAEKERDNELNARNPHTRLAREMAEREAEHRAREIAEDQARNLPLSDALAQWRAGIKALCASTEQNYHHSAQRIKHWAASQGFTHVRQISALALDRWRSQWSPDAEEKHSRFALSTQAVLLVHVRMFFSWAQAVKVIPEDPAAKLRPVRVPDNQTWPLTPAQFDTLIVATRRFDEMRQREDFRSGAHMRAMFLVQRWAGLRIGDALALPRYALVGNRLTLTTQKTKVPMTCLLPDEAVEALLSVPTLPGQHPDFFFLLKEGRLDYQIKTWQNRVRQLRDEQLDFRDERGKPMRFHTHMLRDTFAVELLLAGMPIEKVSRLLGHKSIKTTEKYYAPWVKRRTDQLEDELVEAMRAMGAKVTGPAPAPAAQATGSGPVLVARGKHRVA